MPPIGPTMKIFYTQLYMKRCVFAVFQQELQNSTIFDGLLFIPLCEIASDMTPASPNAFENQLQAV